MNAAASSVSSAGNASAGNASAGNAPDAVRTEPWLVMFKNETHNHPTEIEPFGGAATCLGGAIRDPLSGRSYVYQAMRVTGAGDPRAPFDETLAGKLPQRKITLGAARGYSSYGNQIGLATGLVAEVYHPGFIAKRMEIGAVVAAGPQSAVTRGTPAPGDVIVLAGGRTGRDGIGGATGSSKEHTETALQNSAEVQKGDAPTERKLQRLFRDPAVARLVKRCNDFGAGGVCVAVGELAPSLDIALDAVPLKYDGLDGTELAISESQERMAVVLAPADVEAFRAAAARENIETALVARVTDTGRLRMTWRGRVIVDLRRDFIDTNGVRQTARAFVVAPPAVANAAAPAAPAPAAKTLSPAARKAEQIVNESFPERWVREVGALNCCSQRGLGERFDATIGAGSVLHPFGGKNQITPAEAMVAKIPVLDGDTDACTYMAYGYDPALATRSPAHGAIAAVVDSVARVVAAGADPKRVRLTFQEYFPKLGTDPARWGLPVAALLGAFKAQMELGLPAIGGKDSMSGSFKNLDVPPTLVSFAIAAGTAADAISPEFKRAGSRLVLIEPALEAAAGATGGDVAGAGTGAAALRLPDLRKLRAVFDAVHAGITGGRILSARTIRAGGLAAALTEMALGNDLGIYFSVPDNDADALFAPRPGAFILEVADDAVDALKSAFKAAGTGANYRSIGVITGNKSIECGFKMSPEENAALGGPYSIGDREFNFFDIETIPLSHLRAAWETPLENVFPTRAGTHRVSIPPELMRLPATKARA